MYEYIKESVKRGDMYPVPDLFEREKETEEDPPQVPVGVMLLKAQALFNEDINLISWLCAFDIAPFDAYCSLFNERPEWRDKGNIVDDIKELCEGLKDLRAYRDEYLRDGTIACKVAATDEVKDDNNCTIARNDVTTDASKEFAGKFMDGGETPENVQRAQTILAHMKTLGQTEIARYLGGREDIIAKPRTALHRWLNAHGYNVGTPQGFNAAFPNKKKIAKRTINKQVL